MILLENKSDLETDLSFLEKIARFLGANKDIELIITGNKEIAKLNKEYRKSDKPTDVLSFPLEDIPFMPLGSIVVSDQKVKEAAKELGHSEKEELALLFIHGLLHLMGFDHETDSGEMRAKEQETIDYFNLPKSLIIRGE